MPHARVARTRTTLVNALTAERALISELQRELAHGAMARIRDLAQISREAPR